MSAEPSRCTMQRHKQLTLQRCKPNIASNAKHPFLDNDRGFSTVCDPAQKSGVSVCSKNLKCRSNRRHRFCYLLVIRQLCVISRQCLCGVLTVLFKPYLINIKQDTSAVSLECRKAYYLKMRIYLGAVVHKFKRFAVKRGTFISFQPVGLHLSSTI